jgi:uncharacterized membrane protein
VSPGRAATLLLGVAGLAISLYLSVVHLASGQVPLLCSSAGAINCEEVTTSAQSTLGPVPIAFLGVAWFVVLLTLLVRWRGQSAALRRLLWAAAGLLFVFYLIYAELFLIGAICLWCTFIHAIVIVLFLLSLNDYLAPTDINT